MLGRRGGELRGDHACAAGGEVGSACGGSGVEPELASCGAGNCNRDRTARRSTAVGHVDRKRVFNLGYYTWVEQQGISVEDFDRRKNQDFWRARVDSIPAWDRLIQDFNAEVGGRNSP